MSPTPALAFVQIRPDDGPPGLFDADRRFELRWEMLGWHPFEPNRDEYFMILADETEVARLHLNRRTGFVTEWVGVPDLGEDPLRIQLIEVALDARGRSLGTAIVREVQSRHPHSRLIALSRTDATGFWDSLGWDRCNHATDGRRQPLYVGPAV